MRTSSARQPTLPARTGIALRRLAAALRRPWVVTMMAGLVLATALLPVFQSDLLAPADAYFFSNWDTESQALVLAEIEQDVAGRGSSPYGLQNAEPDVQSPYSTFDALRFGARPTATGYAAYPSSLGLQGRFFDLLWHLGCKTLDRLETAESALFALGLVAFLAVVARTVRRTLALCILLTSVLSPWVVSAAHNLYWVPWTWLLPATAAGLLPLAHGRQSRVLCLVGVGVATALKASVGYEFLTTTTLLAASMPVLAATIGVRRPLRRATADAAFVFTAAVMGFLVVLAVHLFIAGSGDPVAGAGQIAADALKRTYGPASLGADGITQQSLQVSPLRVLALYLVDWRSSLLSVGVGGPFTVLALGPGSFWALVVAAAAVPVIAFVRGDALWRRDAVLFVAAALPATSWFVIGKSHAFTATSICFVLWYLILVPVLFWTLLSALGRSRAADRTRTIFRTLQRLDSTSPVQEAPESQPRAAGEAPRANNHRLKA